jgi:putative hydrolase of the HAD superfamily
MDLGNVTVRLRSAAFFSRLEAACDPARLPADWRRVLLDPASGHHAYERGRLSGEGFHALLKERLGLAVDYPAWVDLWNDFFEPNRPMEALVAALRGQVRFWGLSNTNAEHLSFLRGHYPVLAAYEGITASHEAAAAKPEPAIYQAALAALGVDPGEILYLDDVEEYLRGGEALGIHGFHYTFNDAELWRDLRGLGFSLPDTF